MPSKRTAKTKNQPKRVQKAQTKKSAQETSSIIAHDICGVALILVALILALSLTLPDLGVLSQWCNMVQTYCFGVGAMLIPLAIAALGASFFIPQSKGVSFRSAFGLALAATSILAAISLFGSHAYLSTNALSFLTSHYWAQTHGGVWGGIVAFVMNLLFGETIGLVVLLGLFITALILCGFSISHLIDRLQTSRAAKQAEEAELYNQPLSGEHTHLLDRTPFSKRKKKAGSAQKTSYLGDRRASVLDSAETVKLDAAGDADELAPKRKVHPPLETVEMPMGEADAASDDVSTQKTRVLSKKEGKEKASEPDARDIRPGNESDVLELPAMSILTSNPSSARSATSEVELQKTAERLQATLEEFGLKSKVRGWVSGPLVTTFKIEMGEGERVSKITNLEDDISLSLASDSVRIYAPIPGTSLVGIEIPNSKRNNVLLGDVLPEAKGGPLEIAVGRDSEGDPVVVDLAKLPHLLVAGTTGSGKSVMLNDAIMSILMRATPDQIRLILVDPKRVEFTGYAGLPHLYVPVVNEPQQAASSLQWAASEMMRRLKLFEKAGARDIASYNAMVDKHKLKDDEGNDVSKVPYFVIVIDELADLMMVSGKEVEGSIVRIAQLGRAAGIHLIVATQRPSADVVTGLIKANIDNRVALSVDNGMNSRIIIDQNGAEKLLGNGDMLVKLRGEKPRRVQGCYVSDPEIATAVSFINKQGDPEYHDEILSLSVPTQAAARQLIHDGAPADDDPLIWEAAHIIVDSQVGSTSGLQRRLKVGYARAGRIMDMLEEKGIVGPPDGSKPREVLLSTDELEELQHAEQELEGGAI